MKLENFWVLNHSSEVGIGVEQGAYEPGTMRSVSAERRLMFPTRQDGGFESPVPEPRLLSESVS